MRLCLLAITLFLAACGASRERADLVFINGAEPQSIDPSLVTDQVGMRIASALFEGLCRINSEGRPEPGMAEKWDVSPDAKTYTFHLRPGIQWSDGSTLVAADFVASWKRVLTPATGSDYASQLFIVRGARGFYDGIQHEDFSSVGALAVDDQTLRVELENPTPYFIDLCSFATLSPVHLPTIAKHGTAWARPGRIVCNGAYLLEDWRLDERILLRKNPLYWDAANVGMKTVEVLPVSEPNTAVNYFLTGQADLIMDKGMVPVALAGKLKEEPWFHTGPFLGSWFVRFNTTKPPFNDPRIRRAFSLAIDRRRITEKVTQMGETGAWSLTPPGTGRGYEPPAGATFEPEEARRLLAEAGYPGGRGLPLVEYLYFPKPVELSIAVELQAMWQEHLGVTVNLSKQEWRIYLDSMNKLEYSLCRSSWVGDYNDPNTFLEMFTASSGNNRTGWASPAYDAFIAQAAAEPDIAKRNAIFQSAEKMLIADESVILPGYYYVGVQFYHADRLQGVQANLIDDHPFRAMSWKK